MTRGSMQTETIHRPAKLLAARKLSERQQLRTQCRALSRAADLIGAAAGCYTQDGFLSVEESAVASTILQALDLLDAAHRDGGLIPADDEWLDDFWDTCDVAAVVETALRHEDPRTGFTISAARGSLLLVRKRLEALIERCEAVSTKRSRS
jgi:hypothetical protein